MGKHYNYKPGDKSVGAQSGIQTGEPLKMELPPAAPPKIVDAAIAAATAPAIHVEVADCRVEAVVTLGGSERATLAISAKISAMSKIGYQYINHVNIAAGEVVMIFRQCR